MLVDWILEITCHIWYNNIELISLYIQSLTIVRKYPLILEEAILKSEGRHVIGCFGWNRKSGIYRSIRTSEGTISQTVDFEATQKLRWEVRPTFDFKHNSWEFKLRPYFKFPAPWRWHEYEVNADGRNSKKFDYRIDLNASLGIKLSEKSTLNKSVGLVFMYNLYFDNSPQRKFLTNTFDPEGNPILFQAGKVHQMYQMSVKVGFWKLNVKIRSH